MSKVTSKYQVTVPRRIADEFHIRPGDDIEWVPAGDAIRVLPPHKAAPARTQEARLRCYDEATERHRRRRKKRRIERPADRGWTREDLLRR